MWFVLFVQVSQDVNLHHRDAKVFFDHNAFSAIRGHPGATPSDLGKSLVLDADGQLHDWAKAAITNFLHPPVYPDAAAGLEEKQGWFIHVDMKHFFKQKVSTSVE